MILLTACVLGMLIPLTPRSTAVAPVTQCPIVCEAVAAVNPANNTCCFTISISGFTGPIQGTSNSPCSPATTCTPCSVQGSVSLDATSCSSCSPTYTVQHGPIAVLGGGSFSATVTLRARCGAVGPDKVVVDADCGGCSDHAEASLTCGC